MNLNVFKTLVVVILFFCSLTLNAQENSVDLVTLIFEGDQFAEVAFENEKALQKYQEVLNISPNNYDVLWRISRCYVDIGEHMPANSDVEKKAQEETYRKAYDYADRAIKSNPNGFMGYTRRAIANGRIALFKGIWENIGLVKNTKADLEKAIQINPKDPTAYYVYGRTHTKLSEKSKIIRYPLGLGWANMDDAIINYEKSISLRPDFIMYRLDAARAYVEEKKYAKAKEHLKTIETLPTKDEDDDKFRKEAKELLSKISNK